MTEEEPLLFNPAQLDAEGLLDAVGTNTATRHSARYLKERNPRLFDAIALALGYGIPVEVIAMRCAVGENTVRAVAFEAARSVEDSKQALKDNLRKFLHGASMVLCEKLDEIPVEKLPAALAAVHQQLLLAEGQATSITRHETAGTLDDVAAQISAAQEAARQARGRVIDETSPGTGLVLTNNAPENAPLPEADPVGQLVALLAPDPAAGPAWNVTQAPAPGPVSPMESGQDAALSRPLYQTGPDAGHEGHEAGPAVEGEGGGCRARGAKLRVSSAQHKILCLKLRSLHPRPRRTLLRSLVCLPRIWQRSATVT